MNSMNTKTRSAGAIRMGMLGLLVMALLAGALAFVVTRHVVPCRPTQPFSVLGDVKHLGRELKLSDRQMVEIEMLQKELAAQLSRQCRQYCAVRASLGEVLQRGAPASAESRQLIGQMCAIQSTNEFATLEHLQKVSEVLNPEQRKRFMEELTRCLCGEGSCGGDCMERDKP